MASANPFSIVANPEANKASSSALRHCTFAVTVAAPFSVSVQLGVSLPPLEQAPDQIASRPFDTLNVTLVPDANDAEPLPPVLTLMPAGADVTRSPLRPVAVTVSVTVCGGGGGGAGGVTVRSDVRVVPL